MLHLLPLDGLVLGRSIYEAFANLVRGLDDQDNVANSDPKAHCGDRRCGIRQCNTLIRDKFQRNDNILLTIRHHTQRYFVSVRWQPIKRNPRAKTKREMNKWHKPAAATNHLLADLERDASSLVVSLSISYVDLTRRATVR